MSLMILSTSPRVMQFAVTVCVACCLAPAAELFAWGRPDWLETAEHKRFPSERYLTAVGAHQSTGQKAEDLQAAAANARAELAKRIRVRVRQQFRAVTEEFQRAVSGAKRHQLPLRSRQEISVNTENSVDLEIEGIEVRKRYYDRKTKTCYALAVLNREKASRNLKAQVKALYDDARQFVADGRTASRSGKMDLALMARLRAMGARVKALEPASLLRAIAKAPFPMDELPEAELVSEIDALSARLSIQPAVHPRKGPGETEFRLHPFKFRLALSGPDGLTPLAAFPVRIFETKTPQGTLQAGATDSDGYFSYAPRTDVTRIGSSLEAGPDFNTLAGAQLLFVPPSVRFHEILVPPPGPLIGVFVQEHVEKVSLPSPVSPGLLMEILRRAGFRVVTRKKETDSGTSPLALPPDRILSAFSTAPELAIIGRVSVRELERPAVNISVCSAVADLRLLTLPKGKTIAVVRVQKKEAGADPRQAAQRAATAAVSGAAGEIFKQLLSAPSGHRREGQKSPL